MKNIRDAVVIDFETLPIRPRPRHPPVPTDVSIWYPGKKPECFSWGHREGNTHTFEQARMAVGAAWDSGRPLMFHTANLDVDVAEVHMGMPRLPWDRYEDTLPAMFLKDPLADNYRLKDQGEAATERDAVVDWLVEHQPVPGIRLSASRESDNYAGAYVAYAPVPLTRKYVIGDVTKTRRIAIPTFKDIEQRGMLEAYDRERQMLPIALEMERNGIRIDWRKLGRDVELFEKVKDRLDTWIKRRLNAPDLDLDSSDQLGTALVKARVAQLPLTPKQPKDGHPRYQTNKEALADGIKDVQLRNVFRYRAQLSTCLKTFMKPWLAQAEESGGYIFTHWNSTKRDKGDGVVGARTGRFSSTPNFQNMPNEFKPLFKHQVHGRSEKDLELRAALPRAPLDLPDLPRMRGYILPYRDGEYLIDRDYSQQELRVLGHFENGALLQAYLENPWLDFHEHAQEEINGLLQSNFCRKPIKNINLGVLYGMGAGLLAEKAETTVEIARKLRKTLLAVFPGLKDMYDEMKRRAKAGEPIRTWGGRVYYCEPPKFIDGKLMHFDYKLLNVLIQGSAADMTKEAMIRLWKVKPKNLTVLITAHDELLASCPPRSMHTNMKLIKGAMESVEFDVPMYTEGEWSPRNWANLRDYDKKGQLRFRSALRKAA